MLRANKRNIKKYAKELLGNNYSIEKEKELISICTKDSWENYIEGREHESFPITRYMEKINKVLGSFGVESCYPEIPDLYYCNTGDSYSTTILHYKGKLYIGNWGSIVEKYF